MCETHVRSLLYESLLRVEDVFDTAHQLHRTRLICALNKKTWTKRGKQRQQNSQERVIERETDRRRDHCPYFLGRNVTQILI